MLAINKQLVTVAIDGRTNVRSNKAINILLISLGVTYYYANIENKNSMNMAKYLT